MALPRFELTRTLGPDDAGSAADLLAGWSGLSKAAVKDAMNKGAVWLKPARGGSRKRLRRATTAVRAGDTLALYYDAEVLALVPATALCLDRQPRYSLWHKPAGLLSQGSEYGDHCSLLRQVEQSLAPRGPAYLIHRLDREAAGLMLFAHDGGTAAALSRMFQTGTIVKRYRLQLLGDLATTQGSEGRIDTPLDGKPARTDYRVLGYDAVSGRSTVEALLHTGRYHQLRRHFADLGFPVIGDARYGHRHPDGLRLVAMALEFTCPYTRAPRRYQLTGSDIGF